jgi:hypothetical protein
MIHTYECNVEWMKWLKHQPGTMWIEMTNNNKLVIKYDDKINFDAVPSNQSHCVNTQYPAAQEMDTKSIGCTELASSAERLGEDPCQPTEECEVLTSFEEVS